MISKLEFAQEVLNASSSNDIIEIEKEWLIYDFKRNNKKCPLCGKSCKYLYNIKNSATNHKIKHICSGYLGIFSFDSRINMDKSGIASLIKIIDSHVKGTINPMMSDGFNKAFVYYCARNKVIDYKELKVIIKFIDGDTSQTTYKEVSMICGNKITPFISRCVNCKVGYRDI